MLKARSALLTVDLGEDAKAKARLTFAGESDAKAGEEAADSALDLARSGMVMELQEAKKQPRMGRIVALLEDVQAGLRAAKVETKGPAVTATMTVKIDPEKTGSDLIDAIQKARLGRGADEQHQQPQANGPGDAQLHGRERPVSRPTRSTTRTASRC